MAVVTRGDPVARQLALLEVTNPELLLELARNEQDPEVRRTAILLLADQDELKRLAVAPQALVREAAVMGITDEDFLLPRVRAREESSPTGRCAIDGALRTPEALGEAARSAYHGDLRAAAARRVKDPAIAAEVQAAQGAIATQAEATGHGESSSELVRLAVGGAFDVVCEAAAGRLQSQEDLVAVALAAGDRDVLKIVLAKLTDVACLKTVAAKAADAPMRLATAQKAEATTWQEMFSMATAPASSATALGDALAAVALYGEVQAAAAEAVQQACLSMIRQGDESRIPEMTDLLMLYGDANLGEDYLNRGAPVLLPPRTAGGLITWA